MITTTIRSVSLTTLSVLAVLVGSTAGVNAAGPWGSCVSAKIDEPFRLPDGTVHPAGTLMMCEASPFSPVASVHRTYVNGHPAGMFLSKNLRGELEESARPSIVLQRYGDGPLELLGYVRPGGGRNVSYQFSVGRYPSAVASALTATGGPLEIAAAK